LAWHQIALLVTDLLSGLPFPPPYSFNEAVGSKQNQRPLSTIPSPPFLPLIDASPLTTLGLMREY